MLALIAGQGALPAAVVSSVPEKPLICALDTTPPDHVTADVTFRLERLGGLLRDLRKMGVTRVCMCGRVSRPEVRFSALDWRTWLLLPRILTALRRGDDGALRIVIAIFEASGFDVLGAHEAAPDLLLPEGCLTHAQPDAAARLAAGLGDQVSRDQSRADLGQACLVTSDAIVARETESGTDAMLRRVPSAAHAILYKAPKPGQDWRADLPVIGPDTAGLAAKAGLAGIVIEAGGVMVLDQPTVIETLDAAGLFLWVRERPA